MDKHSFLPGEIVSELINLAPKSDIDKKVLLWKKITKAYIPSWDPEALQQVWYDLFQNEQVAIAWTPEEELNTSNIAHLIREMHLPDYRALHQWSVSNRAAYWERIIEKLGIKFEKKYSTVLNLKKGVEDPVWLDGALMNISDSCFLADPLQVAIVQATEDSEAIKSVTYEELEKLVNKIASGLLRQGFLPGDNLVIYMPFTIESVAAYLAIVKAGMAVVSVADSFSPGELKKRIEMTDAKAVLTCDAYTYGGKTLKVLAKVIEAGPSQIIVCDYHGLATLRPGKNDLLFENLLSEEEFSSFKTSPDSTTNILFSSGTTKEPKSIPWTHLTPIKCAADGFYHQNIKAGDVVTWTTGMGWMMAPWLIYASLINKATMALFTGAATSEKFGRFTEEAKVNMLGTIPSVVKAWKNNGFHKKFNWCVKVFSSTGEPSNAEDYFYLMILGKFRAPVIEYCGGTEIGGGYITGSVVQPASPATFTTPSLGLGFYLLNQEKQPAGPGEPGEVFLIPPSIGLTQKLLNRNHHEEYYEGVPEGPSGEVLRKHGDAFEVFEALGTTFYKSVGRVDDAMNLGGIKISAVEIEEVLNKHEDVFETAAISVPSGDSGPEKLVVYFTGKQRIADLGQLMTGMQQLLTKELNPLFRITEIEEINSLPRTASNKLMRRELRKTYLTKKGTL